MEKTDIAIVGGGVMGLAAGWALARRGRRVTVFERFGRGHARGASHGAARNFNTSYPDEPYSSLLVEARRGYGELAEESARPLLDEVGLLRHGGAPVYPAIRDALAAVGQDAELLSAAEAERRFPRFRIDRGAIWIPQAGRIRAAETVAALEERIHELGGQVIHNAPVTGIRVRGSAAVELDLPDGSLLARRAIVTVGAWTARMLGGTIPLPELRVTQEQPAHFRPLDPDEEWPTFMHDLDRARHDGMLSGVYGMRTPGEGIKAGWHGTGPVVDPDHRDYLPVPSQLAALQDYAREWLSGVDATVAEPISCTYTTTPTEDFLLDRVGPIVVGAGFSGHGFKFAPAIGRILGDLATDDDFRAPTAFRLPARRDRLVV